MALPLRSTTEMRHDDARAVARWGTDALVAAAGEAVARAAHQLLGRLYGTRILVVAGPGLNGADGRVAARWLRRRGAHVDLFDVSAQPERVTGYDLYLDAAFGLGCSRPYVAPDVDPRVAVLAVDLPSGVDADSGALLGQPTRATLTVALGALKYAHVNGPGADFVGRIHLAELGIDSPTDSAVLDDRDLRCFTRRHVDDHKWRHAVAVLAGSSAMPGAAVLACEGALAGGASMVRLTRRASPDEPAYHGLSPAVVYDEAGAIDPRVRCVVAGPGLGAGAREWLGECLATMHVPVVLDADALDNDLIAQRPAHATWVLTPHDGEFTRLSGAAPGESRIGAARALAERTGCVVLLKGPTTVVAHPSGALRIVTSGTSRLASAGTGDVLAGLIGAAIAREHHPFEAAALSAHLHGRAGSQLRAYQGARELPGCVTAVLASLE